MSGTNPFRRKATTDQSSKSPSVPSDHVPTSSNPDSGIPPIDTTRAIKTKTVKTVRIISPHSAEAHDPIPDEIYDVPHRQFFSPPPDPAFLEHSDDEPPEDPFAADSESPGSGTEDEAPHVGGLVKGTALQQASQTAASAPSNPFKKTLATLEPQESPGIVRSITQVKPSGVSDTPARPQYDVEDFKKLLLTGEKNASKLNPTTSAPPVSFSQIHNGDSNSNTDTSSASRQSLFERSSSVRHESPQTSRESSTSNDVRQQFSEAFEPQVPKTKPSTPSHRHGKPVQSSGPQIASFEAPSLNLSRSSTMPISRNSDIPLSPSSPSDQNKALPALPLASSDRHSELDETRSRPESSIESKETNASLNLHKKPVPAPPPSRRTRPMSIASVNSGRSIPISEEGAVDSFQFASSPPSRSSNAPAPPPPRRSNTIRGDSSSSVPTVASIPSASDQSAPRDQSPTQSQTARSPLPLTRSPSITASKGGSQTSPASVSPSMGPSPPPPPPPPRRRGSSQSSNNYIPSRLSGTYTMPTQERLRSDSGASSISQLAITNHEPTSEQKMEQKDVLADLTALQREVDELRGKIR